MSNNKIYSLKKFYPQGDNIDYTEIQKTLCKDYGEEFYDFAEDWLVDHYNFPFIYDPPTNMIKDYHPVFRPLLKSIFPIDDESSATMKLVNYSRTSALLNMRIPPHYAGIFDMAYSSRAVGNFGLINMVVDEKYGKGIWSRSTLNCPFFLRQKPKRMIIESYGVSKNGKKISDRDNYLSGIFLTKPDHHKEWENLTPYCDYSYVALDCRLPKNYEEFIMTLDGSVLVSNSAKKKLEYLKTAKMIVRNPHPNIQKKISIFKTNKFDDKVRIGFQEPLSVTDVGEADVIVATSPVDGYVVDVRELNPNVKIANKKVYELTIEDIREAELGCKLESPTGLKCTIAGYVTDKKPVIVINPDQFKDRSMYWELKETGKIHCYPAVSGLDGNISNKAVKISRTYLQGLLCYDSKTRNKIVSEIFSKDNLIFPYPTEILKILESLSSLDVDKLAKKYPIFNMHFYQIRVLTRPSGIYYSVEPTKTYKAMKELKKVGYHNLGHFYKNAIDDFVNMMINKLMIADKNKKSQIKVKGLLRIALFKNLEDIDSVEISKNIWRKLGKPEYVMWAKEPISRKTSIRCLKIIINDECEDQVAYIHPFLGMDYDSGVFNTKIDTDGDLMELIPISDEIGDAMYDLNNITFDKYMKKFKHIKSIKDLPEPPYNYSESEITKVLIDYNRVRSIDQLCVQEFGGYKNRAMFTDLAIDNNEWNQIMSDGDIEYNVFQAEKQNPELKNASFPDQAEFRKKLLSNMKSKSARLPKPNSDYLKYREMESFGYTDIPLVRKRLKSLKKSKHPLLKIFYMIYKNLKII